MSPVDELTLHEAADRLGVHYMTVYRWVRTGRLPARRAGSEWRVARADVERAGRRPRAPGGTRGRPQARAGVAERLCARLVAGDEPGAWALVEETLAGGATPADVYLEVIGPALRAIGDGWATGEVSVAEEHRATVVVQRLLGRLGPRFARPGRKRGTVVVGAPAGEEHALPGTLLADLFRGAGFEVVDLGANTPPASFVEAACGSTRLVAVLIGLFGSGAEEAVRATTEALRAAGVRAPVLVGGGGVHDADHATWLGADAWTGADARAALETVEAIATRS